jgi:hypothetical protein
MLPRESATKERIHSETTGFDEPPAAMRTTEFSPEQRCVSIGGAEYLSRNRPAVIRDVWNAAVRTGTCIRQWSPTNPVFIPVIQSRIARDALGSQRRNTFYRRSIPRTRRRTPDVRWRRLLAETER